MSQITITQWMSSTLHKIVVFAALALALGVLHETALGQTSPNASPIKIGIIGSGNIGSTLGTFWAQA
ncbi:MAG TPA: hypothetical protein VNT76_21490, partial [Candidatus Binatus sp.]|nr:hypothetical protein [Candidatus Binatus sp.]